MSGRPPPRTLSALARSVRERLGHAGAAARATEGVRVPRRAAVVRERVAMGGEGGAREDSQSSDRHAPWPL